MRYLKWIEQYKQKELTPADEQAFEHELMDNPGLRAEKEASDLADALLFTAAHDPAQFAGSGNGREKTFTPRLWQAAVVLVVCLTAFFIWQNAAHPSPAEQKQEAPRPEMQKPERAIQPQELKMPDTVRPPVAVADVPKATSADETPMRQKTVVPGKARPEIKVTETASEVGGLTALNTNTEEKQEAQQERHNGAHREKIAVYTVRGVMDTVLSESVEIALTATEGITFKPGFHAKAGTTFTAKVNTGPLFEKSGLTND